MDSVSDEILQTCGWLEVEWISGGSFGWPDLAHMFIAWYKPPTETKCLPEFKPQTPPSSRLKRKINTEEAKREQQPSEGKQKIYIK